MRTTVWAYGGVSKSLKCLFLLISLLVIASPVMAISILEYTPYFNFEYGSPYGQDVSHYNTSIQRQDAIAPNTTPWEIWIASGIVGLLLFLYSARPIKSLDELEASIITAAISAVSVLYCAVSSFAIDRIAGYGTTSQIFNTTTKATATFYNHEYVYMENHLIYSEPTIGIMMGVFFVVIVAFTLYRVGSHKAFYAGDELV